jgi:hypothetical protein
MSSRTLWLCAALLAGASAHGFGADEPLDDVLHSLAARRHGRVSFVEQQFLALLQRPVESSGELLYDAPNRLEKRTTLPHPETLIVDGDLLTMQRGRRSRVLDLKAYPQILPFVESIRATLAGDRAALERLFDLRFTGGESRWTLDLTPREEELRRTVALIRIDGTGAELLKVEIRQADGDRSLMTLRYDGAR